MAGRPAAVRGGGLTGAHVGMIVFAFVSVAALGGFIFQLTKVKEAEQRAESAERRLSKYGTPPAPVGTYYENEAGSRNTSVFAVMAGDLAKLSELVAGEKNLVAAAIEQRQNELLSQVAAAHPGVVNPGDTLFTAVTRLDGALQQAEEAIQRLTAELSDKEQEVAALTAQLKTTRDAFEAQIAETKRSFQQAEEKFTSELGAKEDQLAELRDTLAATEQQLQQLRREFETYRRETDLERTRSSRQIADLQQKIQSLKGSFDPEAILKKADGRVLRAIPGGDIVYINLGAADNIKVGMGFEVYSQTGGPTQTLRGKASLDVVTVMENTSECRVTRSVPGQPILEGDIVVNIAYEQNRRPKFVIRGEFDLDFDGRIDPDGQEEIAGIIRRWGGQVVPELDESVDYVVIGLAPRVPSLPPNASDIARDQEERRLLELSEFRELIDRARSMYIPVITQNQFLFLTGYTGDMTIRRH